MTICFPALHPEKLVAIMSHMNDLERFDLDSDLAELDPESQLALLDQSDMWSARRRLRGRWMLRIKLSQPSTRKTTNENPQP